MDVAASPLENLPVVYECSLHCMRHLICYQQVVNPETAEETVIKFEQCLEVIEEYVGLPKESDIPHIPMGCNDKEDQSAMDEDGQHHNSKEATPQSAGELCSSPPSHPAQVC